MMDGLAAVALGPRFELLYHFCRLQLSSLDLSPAVCARHLLGSETPGSIPVLARYDGNRPLVPWLIRVFQNWHISQLRRHPGTQPYPDDDVALPLSSDGDGRWREVFAQATGQWLADLDD